MVLREWLVNRVAGWGRRNATKLHYPATGRAGGESVVVINLLPPRVNRILIDDLSSRPWSDSSYGIPMGFDESRC